MTDPRGFLKYKRQDVEHRSIDERVKDFAEINLPLTPDQIDQQATRCMNCGIPFCHGSGCPVKNRIPEFNELVHHGQWEQACANLHSTNNFPEITGRICPAPCESACTLGVNDEPVVIKQVEFQIVEKGFQQGWIKPLIAKNKTGKRVAVIGSGPAGLAAAQQLVRAGHYVVVFEKDESAGGLLRYGIPDFKLSKNVIDRRLEQLVAEGVDFQTGVEVGVDISVRYLRKMFDAVCLTMGAGQPRDLVVDGREYGNVLFAMDYLSTQNRKVAGEEVSGLVPSAEGKNVVVIGGGDTGSDCVGTARRQGAKNIFQLEILPKPPEDRPVDTPWPTWPRIMRQSTSHEEGCERMWSVTTKKFIGDKTSVSQVDCCKVEWENIDGSWKLNEVAGSEFTLDADLVLLAMGFVHVIHKGLVEGLDVELDERGNVKSKDFQSSQPWIFTAGDTATGASLVVRAIDSGRKMAEAVGRWLVDKKV